MRLSGDGRAENIVGEHMRTAENWVARNSVV